MSNTAQWLANRLAFKAKELQTTRSFLLCALPIIHVHKNSLHSMQSRYEIDNDISYALIRQLIVDYTIKAKNNLMSPLSKKVKEGCHAIELINEADLDHFPIYKAYKHIIKHIIGEAPIMHLHLDAVATATGITYHLRSKYKKATVTEILLENCFEEIDEYANSLLMLSATMSLDQKSLSIYH